MNTEQLLKNLSELEKQLQGIKSATEQVKTIAGADKKLVDAINFYTANANQLLQSVQSTAKDDVKEVKEAAIREIKATTKDFQKTTSNLATELTASVDGIKSAAQEQMSGIADGFGKKVDGVVAGFGDNVRDLKESTLQTIGDTATRFTEETKTISEGLSSTVDKLKTIVEDSLSEPLDKDLKETVDKSLKPLVNEEMPKAFAESLVRMEESFEGAQKKIDEDWSKRQKAYDESVKKQQESIDSSVKQLKEQAETFTATVDQFKTSIEGLGARIDGAKEATIVELRQTVAEQADKLNGELGIVINIIKESASMLRSESKHTHDLIGNLGGEVKHRFDGAESQLTHLSQKVGEGFKMTKTGLGELGGAIIEDNKTTRSEISGVFGAVKSNRPLLITTIILLVIVIVLQLAPMALRFLK